MLESKITLAMRYSLTTILPSLSSPETRVIAIAVSRPERRAGDGLLWQRNARRLALKLREADMDAPLVWAQYVQAASTLCVSGQHCVRSESADWSVTSVLVDTIVDKP
jgi:hypothetical protein